MTATPRRAAVDSLAAASYLGEIGVAPEDLAGWKVEVATRAGRDVGLVVTCGTEIHILSLDHRHAMSRRNTLQFLEPIFREHGMVTTRVPITVTDHRLRERLGFTETWRDEQFTYWALTELPFQRT